MTKQELIVQMTQTGEYGKLDAELAIYHKMDELRASGVKENDIWSTVEEFMRLTLNINESAPIIVTKSDGNWKIGTIDKIEFQAKVYDEPSEYGINKGFVSKLWIKGIANYDRGWDMKPKTKPNTTIVERLIEYFSKEENRKHSMEKSTSASKAEILAKADALWLKLKDAFNAEASGYNPNVFISRLGSIGEVGRREVLRSTWWETLDGDSYGDYDVLTRIIETQHNGERLETGIILFGS